MGAGKSKVKGLIDHPMPHGRRVKDGTGVMVDTSGSPPFQYLTETRDKRFISAHGFGGVQSILAGKAWGVA